MTKLNPDQYLPQPEITPTPDIRQVLDSSSLPEAVIYLSADSSRIAYSNPAFRQTFLGPASLPPSFPLELLEPELLQALNTQLRLLEITLSTATAPPIAETIYLSRPAGDEEKIIRVTLEKIGDDTYRFHGHDITTQQASEQQKEYADTHDPLTGFYNHRGKITIESMINRGQHHRKDDKDIIHLSILFLDLDGLKEVNDAQGHVAGDQLIYDFSQKIRHLFRDTDFIIRAYGDNSDEFIIYLPHALPTDWEQIADKLDAFRTQNPRLSFSFGISHASRESPNEDFDFTTAISLADERMRREKEKRRAGRSADVLIDTQEADDLLDRLKNYL